ncbi:helix-turn-helix domain-containing protein [Sinorhizobium fredii]|uniref:helix-turn-helix domain-containing protein n=1 Tax=Rhizobium fredii TaxID=380 RepID=UPI00351116D2
MGLEAAISLRMTNLREQQLAWLEHISNSSGLTLTEIARAAGLTPSTLTRFRANDKFGHSLTAKTVKKIEDATRVPAYESRSRPKVVSVSEGEAATYVADDPTNPIHVALNGIVKQSNHLDLWELKTGSLAAVGYSKGMVVIVDRKATPRNGDAVCAQKFDYRRGTAEVIFRVWRTPYLLTAAVDDEPGQPEIVDNENVAIAGVIIGGLYIRH